MKTTKMKVSEFCKKFIMLGVVDTYVDLEWYPGPFRCSFLDKATGNIHKYYFMPPHIVQLSKMMETRKEGIRFEFECESESESVSEYPLKMDGYIKLQVPWPSDLFFKDL